MESITFWHWLIFGILLVVLEVLAPGVIFLWMGIAAMVTGVMFYFIPGMEWEYQFILFAILSIVSVGGYRLYVRKHPVVDEQPALNRRGQQYVGRILTVTSDIEDGTGKASVDDSQWVVNGADCSAGSKVKVTEVNGTTLHVEPVD